MCGAGGVRAGVCPPLCFPGSAECVLAVKGGCALPLGTVVREAATLLSFPARSQCSWRGHLPRGDGHPMGALAVLALLARPGELGKEQRDGRAAKGGTWPYCVVWL